MVLEEEGFRPALCSDAREALEPFARERPVAVLIDWVIPGGSGLDLCRRIRTMDPVVPILFVSGRDDEASVSRGLDAGADDFLSKPFRRQELAARLEAHLRKLAALPVDSVSVAGAREAVARKDVRTVGGVEVDLGARTATLDGSPVPLGSLEFRLLEYLVRNVGVALSRDQILREVHGYDDIPTVAGGPAGAPAAGQARAGRPDQSGSRLRLPPGASPPVGGNSPSQASHEATASTRVHEDLRPSHENVFVRPS